MLSVFDSTPGFRPPFDATSGPPNIFRHEDPVDNDPSGKFFDCVRSKLKTGVGARRRLNDYEIADDDATLLKGVSLVRPLE